MSLKRSASQMDPHPLRPLRTVHKRTKTSPSDDDNRSDSSVPSSGSVSVASALESSPPASPQQQHMRTSSVSSLPSSTAHSDGEEESEDESSVSSNSSEGSSDAMSDAEDGDDITVVNGPKKPAIAMGKHSLLTGAQDLSARISELLPRLAAANSTLLELTGDGSHGHSLEEVEEGEGYIEMDLGLGVLEEKTGGEGDSDSSGDESGGDYEEQAGADDVPVSSGAVGRDRGQTASDTHILGKLMGQRRVERTSGVEALD